MRACLINADGLSYHKTKTHQATSKFHPMQSYFSFLTGARSPSLNSYHPKYPSTQSTNSPPSRAPQLHFRSESNLPQIRAPKDQKNHLAISFLSLSVFFFFPFVSNSYTIVSSLSPFLSGEMPFVDEGDDDKEEREESCRIPKVMEKRRE